MQRGWHVVETANHPTTLSHWDAVTPMLRRRQPTIQPAIEARSNRRKWSLVGTGRDRPCKSHAGFPRKRAAGAVRKPHPALEHAE
jgi:hypothetical protein